MNRTRVLGAVLLALLLAHLSWAADRLAATVHPDHLTLSWTANPATTQTITWRTDTTATAGRVQYQAGATLTAAKEVTATARAFTTDLQATRLFTATLTHLAPHAKYAYRVGDGKNWSETHTFTTADPACTHFTFLVFGDSQSDPGSGYAVWGKTAHNAYHAYPAAKFMMNLGDLVDVGPERRPLECLVRGRARRPGHPSGDARRRQPRVYVGAQSGRAHR